MYYIRFRTSLLIQLITCFYYSYSIGNLFLSLLIDDVTQLFLLRLVKESECECIKVDYSIGENVYMLL